MYMFFLHKKYTINLITLYVISQNLIVKSNNIWKQASLLHSLPLSLTLLKFEASVQ